MSPRGRSRRSILGVAVAIALAAAAGCGEDDEPRGADLTETRCPLVQAGDGNAYLPADDSFDTAELVGEPFERARATAAEHGCDVVVAKRDGEGVPVPTDIDPARIYVYTQDGVVTEIEGVGGGI